MTKAPRSRPGFLITDCVIALSLITFAVLSVTQLALFAKNEHARGERRFEAIEATSNIMETARSLDWNSLTPEWAAAQKLPDHLASGSETLKLTVTVEPEAKRPRIKRVVVRIDRIDSSGHSSPSIVEIALFAAREKEGGS